jgi:hypothetical protein
VHITVYGEKYHTEHAGALGGPLDVAVEDADPVDRADREEARER